MRKDAVILIVGHDDIIENSLREYFEQGGYSSVYASSKLGLDAAIQPSVYAFFQKYRPEYVFLGSTRSGGIQANQDYSADFIYHNCASQNNVIYAAQKFGARKLMYFASSCVYPKECGQPMKEEYLLGGPLEKTSEPYAVAKLAGIKLCQAYRRQYHFEAVAVIPATVYGPGADTDIATAHVMGALVSKFSRAVKNNDNEVVVWGSGNPRREFIYIDDFIKAALLLMENYGEEPCINIGVGSDVSIRELAEMIKKVAGFKGSLKFDSSKADGAPRKLLDSSRLKRLGFLPEVSLEKGVKAMWEWVNTSQNSEAKR